MPPKRKPQVLGDADINTVHAKKPRSRRQPKAATQKDVENEQVEEEVIENATNPLGLPELPIFMPKPRKHQNHHDAAPQIGGMDGACPWQVFGLIFTSEIFELLAANTNSYALNQQAKEWKETTGPKIQIFMGLIIWMGTMRLPSVRDYWDTSNGDQYERWVGKMSRNRFELLKRNFHVAHPDKDCTGKRWWRKVEPLASHCRDIFQKIYLPSSQPSIDEQMAQFGGHSSHTIKLPNKPIDQGYGMFTTADHGYTIDFTFQESKDSWAFLPQPPVSFGLNNTSRMV